jgi:uncharacterized membrane protein YbhN (UPF0104 family)
MFTQPDNETTRWFSKNRGLLLRLFGTLLATTLIVLLIQQEGWSEIVEALKQVSLLSFFLALAALMISRIFVVARWYVLLRSGKVTISFSRTAELTFTGLFAANFLPTTIGGDVVRLAGTMQLGYDQAICLASLAADRLIGLIGMAFVAPLGLAPTWQSLGQVAWYATALPLSLQKFIHFARRTLRTLYTWLRQPKALIASLVCTWGNMLFIFGALSILINGLGYHVSFGLIAGLWSLSYFVTLVPISINGYGVQELSLTFLLSHVAGLSTADSLTIAVLIRIIFMFCSLPGAVFLPTILSAMDRQKLKNSTPSK